MDWRFWLPEGTASAFLIRFPVLDRYRAGLYFVDGLVAIIGRWPLFLLGQLFPIGHYAPFLMDLLGVFLMVAAAILWCALLQHILDRPLSTWACLVFSGAFVNFALNSEVFIYYLHNGAGLGSCLIPLSLISGIFRQTFGFKIREEAACIAYDGCKLLC